MSIFATPIVADADKAQQAFTPLPDDVYTLLIDSAEEKTSKNNNAMLAMQVVVQSGEKTGAQYEGRKLFHNFNMEHANPVVVDIATKQLHALLIMTGMKQINDATELTGRVFKAHVKVTKRKDTGEMQNEISFAVKKGETPTAQPTETAPSTAPKAQPDSKW